MAVIEWHLVRWKHFLRIVADKILLFHSLIKNTQVVDHLFLKFSLENFASFNVVFSLNNFVWTLDFSF